MTTTNTYTLNSTTAHDLKEGDTLTLARTGEAYGVHTILPCGRGFSLGLTDLRDHRNIYGMKASALYGFEVTHTEETPDPVPETDLSDEAEPLTTYTITTTTMETTYTDRRTAYNALRDILEVSDDARTAFEEWVTTNHEALGTPLDLSDENFDAWCEFSSDCLLCNAEDRGAEDFFDITITASTDYISAPSAPVEETAATTPEAPHSYIVDEVQEFEYTGGGIWVVCGWVHDTTTEERFFFDSSICSAYAEGINIYSKYPYFPDEEDVAGCSFQPLPNYGDLVRDYFDPDESAEGRALWREILASDAVPEFTRAGWLDLVAEPSTDSPALTLDDSVTATRYFCGDGFFCDVEEYGDRFEAWLGHRDYGIRSLMFGVPRRNTETLDGFREMVEANLPEYVEGFRSEHMGE